MFADTLHGTLDEAAGKFPEVRVSFPAESSALTLAELSSSSTALAHGLLRLGIRPGDRVGLLCPNEPWFLQALFAVSRVGAATCPLPLPATLNDLEGYVARLGRIRAAAGIRHVVVTEQYADLADMVAELLPEVSLTRPADLAAGTGGQVGGTGPAAALADVDPHRVVIVQFTSGSTAAPKGVPLTHLNVLTCLDAIVDGVQMGLPGDTGGIWLPLYHDMGLFGALSALLVGVPVAIWSPLTFVKNPARWLRTVSDTGMGICPCPNFGYDYLVSAVDREQAASFDLSRWRVAFNGAETIAVDSVEAFLDRFSAAGFRPESMLPVYGLAEATLAVSFPPLGRAPMYDWVDGARLAVDQVAVPVNRGDPGARGVVAVGRAVRGMSLRVADPDTAAPLPDARVGEVQVRGASVTSGYLSDDPAVAQPFTPDGWLKTGDLGYLRDGELYVTGRIKEMIVVRGVNFYPEDVEAIVRGVPGVHKRRCIAFTGAGETMTLVAEADASDPAERARLHTEILRRVTAATGLTELDVRLVPPRSIPRTTSGKLQRLAMREALREQR